MTLCVKQFKNVWEMLLLFGESSVYMLTPVRFLFLFFIDNISNNLISVLYLELNACIYFVLTDHLYCLHFFVCPCAPFCKICYTYYLTKNIDF